MGDLWGVLFQVGLVLFPLAALAVVVVTVLWVSRRRLFGGMARERPNDEDAIPVGSIASEPLAPAERRAATASAVAIAVSGLCLPWVVGLSVKAYLDFVGEPTLPVSSFLDPLAVVVLLGATVGLWCCPFLVLAAWVRARGFVRFAPGRSFRERLLLAWVTHIAGLVAGVVIFVPVFRQWDVMYIFVPIAGFILVPMIAAYAGGRLVLRVRDGWSRP
jgi:hypothetical protein